MYTALNQEPPTESLPTTACGIERGARVGKVETKAKQSLGPSRSRKLTKVKMQDVYSFNLEVSREEALIIHQVKERVKEQGRVWWAMEAKNGAGWYLQPEIFAQAEGYFVSSLSLVTMTSTSQLKKLIRSGIPPQLRPRVWSAVSGASRRRSLAPESYYSDLLAAVEGRETPATRQIDHDLGRTFPTHPWIDSADGRAALRRILVAYSFRDSRVGYCQGLNFVAAMLLLIMKKEEDAFWMLAVLVENVLFDDCYSENLYGCHVEQRVFKDLLRKKLPRLAARLEEIEFDVSLVTTEWFLCLFAKSLPSETAMRVWDVLFNEGASILFIVALAIFKMREEELLAAKHVGEVMKILSDVTHSAYDPDELLKVAFDKVGVMSLQSISKQRKKEQPAVMAELERRGQRLNPSDSV
ncbi:hypothetical protein KC19_VG198400 [Ceratodon purpureus]|uniref:Rab-GAP TBC domain-containing protein n=1 Tax=Ceratodon purpureus TaxID=3225 RepID=A0A8T0HRW0_CERPU|nr:hypothetical protein KC19_VG198400 [Ceratodon purpureus]